MVGILINSSYEYENIVLESGAKVSASQVTIQEDKVIRIDNGNVTIKDDELTKSFIFSIQNYGVGGEKTYNLNGLPEGVDGQAIVKEFVEFVESDIKGTN